MSPQYLSHIGLELLCLTQYQTGETVYCSNIHGSRILCTIVRIALYYWSGEQWTPSRHARSLRHGTGHGGANSDVLYGVIGIRILNVLATWLSFDGMSQNPHVSPRPVLSLASEFHIKIGVLKAGSAVHIMYFVLNTFFGLSRHLTQNRLRNNYKQCSFANSSYVTDDAERGKNTCHGKVSVRVNTSQKTTTW